VGRGFDPLRAGQCYAETFNCEPVLAKLLSKPCRKFITDADEPCVPVNDPIKLEKLD
jgi:hypothetical protein